MLQFLIQHSVSIIGIIAITFLGMSASKEYMKKHNMTTSQFFSEIRRVKDEVGTVLLAKLITASLITLVVSLISFRQIWMNDTFHVVFLTIIIYPRLEQYLKSTLK